MYCYVQGCCYSLKKIVVASVTLQSARKATIYCHTQGMLAQAGLAAPNLYVAAGKFYIAVEASGEVHVSIVLKQGIAI